ncbi:hypothetical protein BCR42DRAFT_415496, partial [Absidia repens]
MQNSPSLHHHHSFLQFPCSISSSASFMPQQVEPPTTVQTKSSFSEIEPIHEIPLYHLTLSEPSSFISPSLHTSRSIEPFISPLTETNLDYHKSTFCSSFEAKQHHVDSFIQNQKALLEQEHELQRKTKAEIQSLIPLNTRSLDEELVLDDSQQQWTDLLYSSPATTSRKRFSFSSLPTPTSDRRGRTALINSWFSNVVDYKGHETNGTTGQQPPVNETIDTECGRTPRKQWLKSLIQWLRFGQGKKRAKIAEGNDEAHQLQHHDLQRQSPLSLATMTATSIEEEKLRYKMTVDPTLEDDCQHYDERRHQSKKAARHVSWSMGTSFEEYRLDKARSMEHDFYDNNTRNGSQRRSKIPHLFFPTRNADAAAAAAAYMDEPPSPSTPTTPSFLPHSAPASPTSSTNQKKGFGLSFVQHSLSSTKRSLLHPQKNLTRRRKRKVYHITAQDTASGGNNDMEGNDENINTQPYFYRPSVSENNTTQNRRYSSGHLIESYSPRLSALKEEAAVTDVAMMAANNKQNLVAFRYPRMVRMKNLRGAAKHGLPLDKNNDGVGVGVGSGSGDDIGNGDERMDNGHAISSGNWISSQLLYKYSSQKMGILDPYDDDKDVVFGVENGGEDDDDDDNSLVKYSRQYRNSTKRRSDPGAGLSAPPFPIGRPLSSFY